MVKFYIKEDFKTKYMKLRDWSVDDLSEKLGLKKQQVSRILNGKIEPSMFFLHKLAEITGIGAEELLETKFK